MGRCPRAAAISGVMRHGTLAYRAGTRVSRDVVGSSGRATVARPAGDGAGAARGLGPGCTERRSLRLSYRSNCAFPSRCRPGGVGRNPPASLRGTMENGSTGQMRSSNPPPGWRGGCAKAHRSRPSGPTARKDAVGVYTNRRKWPLDVGLGHLCTLLRASCVG